MNPTLNIKPSSTIKTNFNLSHRHITSARFGEFSPITSVETIAGDNFKKFNVQSFIRTAPLALPTYARINVKTKAFHVPTHILWDYFEDWYASKKYSNGSEIVMPILTPEVLSGIFVTTDSYNTEYLTLSDRDDYDVFTNIYEDTTHYFLFTQKGKFVYKVLRSLGYCPSWSRLQAGFSSARLNPFPLLAYFRINFDYFMRSFQYDKNPGVGVLETFRHNAYFAISSDNLTTLFDSLSLCYPTDYFTRGWNTPNSPLAGVFVDAENFDISRLLNDKNQLGNDVNSTQGMQFNDIFARGGNLTSLGVQTLSAIDSYMRRAMYAGNRTMETLCARLGVKLDCLLKRVPTLVASSSSPLEIGDVTATAESEGSPLGGYAGKAIGVGNLNFDYRCKDMGYLICIQYIDVNPLYGDGISHTIFQSTPTDFYTPDFDGVGVDTIRAGELLGNTELNQNFNPLRVFGFMERYNQYREHGDLVTGDVNSQRYNETSSLWSLKRDVSSLYGRMSQDYSFCGFDDCEQYARIFTDITADEDYFFVNHSFDILAERPIKNYTGASGLPQGDVLIHQNGMLD